jgi:hypothetical protein
VPDVTKIPFFNTVGPALAARTVNPVAQLVYISSTGAPAVVQTANPATGLITLTARAALAQGFGTGGLYTNNFPSPLAIENGQIYWLNDSSKA